MELPITLFVLLLYFTLDKFGVITLQLSEYIDARDFPFSLYFYLSWHRFIYSIIIQIERKSIWVKE